MATHHQQQRRPHLHHPIQPSISSLAPSSNNNSNTSSGAPDRPRSVEPQLYLRTQHAIHPSMHARRGSNDSRASSSSSSGPAAGQGQGPGALNILRPASTVPTSSSSSSSSSSHVYGHGRNPSNNSSSSITASMRTAPISIPTAVRPSLSKNSPPISRSYTRTPLSSSVPLSSPIMARQTSTSTSTSTTATATATANEDWKARIHREARVRFSQMVREADMEFQAKLAQVSSSGGVKFRFGGAGAGGSDAVARIAREHKQSVEELEKLIKEEAEERVRVEESRRRSIGGSAGVFAEDDYNGEDEVVWRPDVGAGNKSSSYSSKKRMEEEVVGEQQVILETIRRDSGIVRPVTSVGYREASSQGLRRVRWANDLRGTSSSSSQSQSPTPTQTQYHERWIPSVTDYTNELREYQHPNRTRTSSMTPAHSNKGKGKSNSEGGSRLQMGYQQRLDEMATRLKRELAIST